MKNTEITYKDIRSFPEHRRVDNGLIVDEKTVAEMKKIERSLSRLAPMADDNVRYLWFRVDPGKPEDWADYETLKAYGDVEDYDDYIRQWKEDVDENSLWYRIAVGYVDNFHYMLISDNEHNLYDIRSAHYVGDRGHDTEGRADYSELMAKIGAAIGQRVEDILIDGGKSYMEWLEMNLPYSKRVGTINRHLLYKHLGISRLDNPDTKKLIGILESDAKPNEFDKMTLRQYIEMWVRCYRAVYPEKGSDVNPLEIFKSHNSKGYEAFEHDLDTEEGFNDWEASNSSYHCLDVVYARVHLFALKDDEGGKWHYCIHTSSFWNLDQYLAIVEKLFDEVEVFEYGNRDIILPILKEDDKLEFTPGAYRYFQGDGVGSQMTIWDLPDELRDKVIADIDWVKQQPVQTAKD